MKPTDSSATPRWGVVVLAAGQGTRMRSETPKVLHELAGRQLIDHVLDRAFEHAEASDITVVVGHCAETVEAHIRERRVGTALQSPQLGTGHALQVGLQATAGDPPDAVLVLSGDVPLLRTTTLDRLRASLDDGAAAAVLTADLERPGAYGRVLRDTDGRVHRIVEARDADEATLECTEVNAGIYAFSVPPLTTALTQLQPDNAQGEYYLTDVVDLFRQRGLRLDAVCLDDAEEMSGVNNRRDLAAAAAILNRRTLGRLMDEGVTVIDPATTWIEAHCDFGRDVVIEPGVVLRGACRVGDRVRIGAHSVCDGVEIPPDEVIPPLSRLV